MQKLFLLFSHTLTPEQIQDAKQTLHCSDIIYLPEELQEKWSHVDPVGDLDDRVIQEFITYLKDMTSENDYILIQGDFGLCYVMVKWCQENDRIPLYSTTYRNSKDKNIEKGKIQKTQLFKHINFRRYPK
ncbi:MAG TPA: hypothetical protein ENG70_03040 [Candidatus Cloacimonetes bacterium]|nr:hypothetical protein [Candidatus Cloacimonadota bacterium]HEX37819.1 hypothetical protein [Candidatus Cloacimonadota bacterium]